MTDAAQPPQVPSSPLSTPPPGPWPRYYRRKPRKPPLGAFTNARRIAVFSVALLVSSALALLVWAQIGEASRADAQGVGHGSPTYEIPVITLVFSLLMFLVGVWWWLDALQLRAGHHVLVRFLLTGFTWATVLVLVSSVFALLILLTYIGGNDQVGEALLAWLGMVALFSCAWTPAFIVGELLGGRPKPPTSPAPPAALPAGVVPAGVAPMSPQPQPLPLPAAHVAASAAAVVAHVSAQPAPQAPQAGPALPPAHASQVPQQAMYAPQGTFPPQAPAPWRARRPPKPRLSQFMSTRRVLTYCGSFLVFAGILGGLSPALEDLIAGTQLASGASDMILQAIMRALVNAAIYLGAFWWWIDGLISRARKGWGARLAITTSTLFGFMVIMTLGFAILIGLTYLLGNDQAGGSTLAFAVASGLVVVAWLPTFLVGELVGGHTRRPTSE